MNKIGIALAIIVFGVNLTSAIRYEIKIHKQKKEEKLRREQRKDRWKGEQSCSSE